MDLLDFLECLKERNIRYLKDYSVTENGTKWRIVIPEHFLALSLYPVEDGTVDGDYRVLAMEDLDAVVAAIDEQRKKPRCPICGRFVTRIETHVEHSIECRGKYKEYTKLLLDLTKGPPKIADEALVPLVYKIEGEVVDAKDRE